MNAEQEVRQQREALAEAVNRHDLEAIKSFLDPSYVGRSKSGQTVGYQEMIQLVEPLLAPGSDFAETVEIEDLTIHGDEARLSVRRSHTVTRWLWIKHRGTSQAVETWRQRNGRWRLVEEQEL